MNEIKHTIIHIGNREREFNQNSYEASFMSTGRAMLESLGGKPFADVSARDEAIYLLPTSSLAQALLGLRSPTQKSFVRVYNLAPQEFQAARKQHGGELLLDPSSYELIPPSK